jgi:hypothetical protein
MAVTVGAASEVRTDFGIIKSAHQFSLTSYMEKRKKPEMKSAQYLSALIVLMVGSVFSFSSSSLADNSPFRFQDFTQPTSQAAPPSPKGEVEPVSDVTVQTKTTTVSNDPKEMAPTPEVQSAPAPEMRVETETREAYRLGTSLTLYGGATAFQSGGELHLSTPSIPGANLINQTKGSVGEVAGIKLGYTWGSFDDIASGRDAQELSHPPELIEPSLGIDFFWSGFRYKSSGSGSTSPFGVTTGYSDTMTANVDSYSFCLEPTIKFNLGNLRPYIGFGIGGTYSTFDHVTLSGNAGAVNLGNNFSGSSDDIDLTAEGLAGIEYFFAPHWALSFDYKFVYLVDPSFKNNSSGPIQQINYHISGLDEHMFLGGISYYF